MSETFPDTHPITDPSLLQGNAGSAPREAPHRMVQFGRIYEKLENGQAVNIADTSSFGGIFLEIDEENLGLEGVSLESLESGWDKQKESFTAHLAENGIEADPFTVFKWYQIQSKVFRTLGPPNPDEATRSKRFKEHGDTMKLSETKGFAMCSEYATLSAYIAQKVGEPVNLIIGAATHNEEGWRQSHAFVWVNDLNAIYDGARAQTGTQYPSLMLPKAPATLETLEAGYDVEAQRIGGSTSVHYGLMAMGFGINSEPKS